VADILKSEYKKKNLRGQRGHRFVIVDEVDSMFIDSSTNETLISTKTVGMECINKVFLEINKSLM
jgi:preprotein translocase subunit SecA